MASAVYCFAQAYSWQYTTAVAARSSGVPKPVYAEINGQKTENHLPLMFTKNTEGVITIESPSFKLGTMPFSASFKHTIKPQDIHLHPDGTHEIHAVQGVYTVLFVTYDAFLDGTFSESACSLTLKVKARNKDLVVDCTYAGTTADAR
ncbi:MAG: hypothetical protein ACTTJ7_06455 [Treponema sp.]